MRRLCFALIIMFILAAPLSAQDALDLPSELYVLLNEGTVQRYGRGVEGISTVTPEGEFVLDFGIAPNGEWMAYRTETDLIVRDLNSDSSTVIESGSAGTPLVRGKGDTIVWSPGRDAIAVTTEAGGRVYLASVEAATIDDLEFTAIDLREGAFSQFIWSPDGRYLAAEAEGNVWWIYRLENDTFVLSSAIVSSIGLAFVNTIEVVFAPAEGGLVLMNLANSNTQTILLDSTWNYGQPYLLPDGMLAVFGRQKDDANVEVGFGRLLGLKPGVSEIAYLSEIPVQVTSVRWAPGGDWLVNFENSVFSLVDPLSGQAFVLPVAGAVAYTWGPLPTDSGDQPT